MTPQLEAATPDEIALTYDRARSMIGGAPSPEESLFLRKPLEIDAGGSGHMGRDSGGRDIYATVDAEGYVALRRWAIGRSTPCP
jgi:hypothetical protein